jgi:hypothetical protein
MKTWQAILGMWVGLGFGSAVTGTLYTYRKGDTLRETVAEFCWWGLLIVFWPVFLNFGVHQASAFRRRARDTR